MSMGLQNGLIAAFAAVQESCDAGHSGRTGRSALRRLAVTDACKEESGHLQTLAERLQFGKRGDVAKEISDFLFVPTSKERLAEPQEKRIRSPGAFGETAFTH